MGTTEDVYIGAMALVSVEVGTQLVEVARECHRCQRQVKRDFTFCPVCGGRSYPVHAPSEDFFSPRRIEGLVDILVDTNSMCEPETVERNGSRYKDFLMISNSGAGGSALVGGLRVIGCDMIEASMREFVEKHEEHLEILRGYYGPESVEVVFGAVICYW